MGILIYLFISIYITLVCIVDTFHELHTRYRVVVFAFLILWVTFPLWIVAKILFELWKRLWSLTNREKSNSKD